MSGDFENRAVIIIKLWNKFKPFYKVFSFYFVKLIKLKNNNIIFRKRISKRRKFTFPVGFPLVFFGTLLAIVGGGGGAAAGVSSFKSSDESA